MFRNPGTGKIVPWRVKVGDDVVEQGLTSTCDGAARATLLQVALQKSLHIWPQRSRAPAVRSRPLAAASGPLRWTAPHLRLRWTGLRAPRTCDPRCAATDATARPVCRGGAKLPCQCRQFATPAPTRCVCARLGTIGCARVFSPARIPRRQIAFRIGRISRHCPARSAVRAIRKIRMKQRVTSATHAGRVFDACGRASLRATRSSAVSIGMGSACAAAGFEPARKLPGSRYVCSSDVSLFP